MLPVQCGRGHRYRHCQVHRRIRYLGPAHGGGVDVRLAEWQPGLAFQHGQNHGDAG